jgi:hypothetical protein
MKEFREFIDDPKRNFSYSTAGELQIEQLEEILEEDGYSDDMKSVLQRLKDMLGSRAENDFDKDLDLIKMAIMREIASNKWGTEAGVKITFPYDTQIQAAVDLVKDQDSYREILRGKEISEKVEAKKAAK